MRYEITRLCFGLRHGDVGYFRAGEVLVGDIVGNEPGRGDWVRFSCGVALPLNSFRGLPAPVCRRCGAPDEFNGGRWCLSCITSARACAGERAEA